MGTGRVQSREAKTYKGVTIVETHGVEGGVRDPYSYTRHDFYIKRWFKTNKVRLHLGLCDSLSINDKELCRVYKEMPKYFKKYTGWDLEDFLTTMYEYAEEMICPECGGDDFMEKPGLPGETFTLCAKCSHIMTSSLNLSSIE